MQFQRRALRDKKASLSEQCKEIEKTKNGKDQISHQDNSRYQGDMSCKDGTIKDRNSMNLTQAEDIKEMSRIQRRSIQKRF